MSYRHFGRGVSTVCVAALLCAAASVGHAQPAKPTPEGEPPAEPPAGPPPAEQAPPADESTAGDDNADASLDEEGPDPARPAPAGKGAIWGVIEDARNHEPLMEAEVELVGTGLKTVTDLDGRYRFEVPPGSYKLRVWYPLYKPQLINGVVVKLGQLQRVNEKLVSSEGGVEEMVIVAEAARSSVEGQLNERKKAVAVGDSVGRAEIAKTPDKNAAQAARRVVGATIVGSRFVYVRGLGQRYTNALLDGAPLPSPEPDQQTVPLDLFPSSMLDGLTIAKTFTPDSPGDFAGGSVRIATRRVPDAFTFSSSLSLGVNTQSTFRQGLTYDGGSLDWLGIDDGSRSLPKSVPDYKLQRGIARPDGSLITRDDMVGYGKAINTPMNTRRGTIPPNHSGNVVIGYGAEVGAPDRKIGVMAALTYSRSFEVREDEVVRTYGFNPLDNTLRPRNNLLFDRMRDQVRVGALGSATFEASKNHSFHLTGLQSISSDKEAREIEGFHEERGAIIHETRLGFVSRRLTFGQLRGEHRFEVLSGAEMDWNLSLAYAARDEPDRRSTVYEYSSGDGYRFEDDSQSGLHFLSNQSETSIGGGLNWTQPLGRGSRAPKLKFGSLLGLRNRTFDARSLRFRPSQGAPFDALTCGVEAWDPGCPTRLFSEGNIGPILQLEENTRGDSAYTATLNVLAGYAMLDSQLSESVRLVIGQRVEASEQTINSFDPFNPELAPVQGGIESIDLLPAIAATFRANQKTNLRMSVSRTLARPQLRELAPFAYVDFFGAREVQGNPDLAFTHIINADVRIEMFPTLREVLAASVFYKNFKSPIEQVVEANKYTFQNADGANLMGIELEVRKNFDFILPQLSDLSLVANVTLSRSRVQIAQGTAAAVTSPSRPLANQAPFIINAALDYDNETSGTRARVLYNIAGPRLVAVGLKGIDDVYEQPRHQLDVTVAQRLYEGLEARASASNIFNDSVRRTHGTQDSDDRTVSRYTTGVSFSVGASYRY